ncbi:MAG TPA: hypothetical protein VIH26_03190 [Anaerolineales bacterium]
MRLRMRHRVFVRGRGPLRYRHLPSMGVVMARMVLMARMGGMLLAGGVFVVVFHRSILPKDSNGTDLAILPSGVTNVPNPDDAPFSALAG